MGLIKALTTSVTTGLGDQFKEFVTCPQGLANDVIIARGIVNHGAGNPGASVGVISNGSAIAVPQGWSMMIIDNGKIAEFTAEDGTYTWDTSSEPSIFCGGLGKGIVDTIKNMGNRFTFGGQTAKDQRVYFIKTTVIPGNLFGSQQPETIFDPVYGSVEITYNGEYNIRVDDPAILVGNIVGANPNKDVLTYDEIFKTDGNNILKSRFAQKVSEAIANIMDREQISFNKIQGKKSEVTDEMNTLLDAEWHQKYGIVVEDVSLRVNASEESLKIIREMDAKVAETTRMGQVYSQNMQGAMAAATGEAMKTAAGNENGAMMGFAGLNMAQGAGAGVMGAVANMPSQPAAAPAGAKFCPNCGTPTDGAKFCPNCGTKLGE